MKYHFRWLLAAVLLAMLFTTLGSTSALASSASSTQRNNADTLKASQSQFPTCGPALDGYIYTIGGNRYKCVCVKVDASKPCQWVWRNLDVKTYNYLAMDQSVVITSFYKANFYLQPDGNLVDYDEYGRARWASGTVGRGYQTIFQTDGNLVVYNSYNYPVWASNTAGTPGASLAIQADGNIVIYNFFGFPVWSTGTYH